jgi:LysR family cyn operon transcriptional activator
MRKQLTVDAVQSLNLNHLRYFYEVARAGNMRRAALRLGVSQPALSKQIQALEDALGLPLFFRTARGLQPTDDGEVVHAHSERIFGHIRELETELDARRRGAAGRLTIGAVHSVAAHLLPPYVARYREAWAMVRLRIHTARSRGVLRALSEHRVDVGLVAEAPRSDGAAGGTTLAAEDLELRPIRRTPLVIVAAPKSPLGLAGAGGPIALSALHRADMVAFDPPAPTRRVVERHLAARQVTPRVMAECPDISTLRELVVRGLGFGVVPRDAVETDLTAQRLVEVPVKGWDLSRTIALAHGPLASLSPVVRHFVELFPRLET